VLIIGDEIQISLYPSIAESTFLLLIGIRVLEITSTYSKRHIEIDGAAPAER